MAVVEREKTEKTAEPIPLRYAAWMFNYESLPLLQALGYGYMLDKVFIPWTMAVLGEGSSIVVAQSREPGWIHNIALTIQDGGTGVGAFIHVDVLIYGAGGEARPWTISGPVAALRASRMECIENVKPCYTDFEYSSGSYGYYTVLYQSPEKPLPVPYPFMVRVSYPSRDEIQYWLQRFNAIGKADLASLASDALANYGAEATVYYTVEYTGVKPWQE